MYIAEIVSYDLEIGIEYITRFYDLFKFLSAFYRTKKETGAFLNLSLSCTGNFSLFFKLFPDSSKPK